MEEIDYENETWSIIYNYFDSNPNYLVKHHIDSFNDFIINKIPQIIKQYNPQIHYKNYIESENKYKYTTKVYYGGKDGDKVYIGKPILYKKTSKGVEKKQMYPNEARLRDLTYASHIFIDIYIEYYIYLNEDDKEPQILTNEFKNVSIGKIPIMLQSKLCVLNNTSFELKKQMGECPFDQGGYFIVDGSEKVIVSHERKAENKLYIVPSKDGIHSFSAQIKSIPENSFKFARTTIVNIREDNGEIYVRLPMLSRQIPLFLLFRALGIETDKEILKYILYNFESEKSKLFIEELTPSIVNNGNIYDSISAIKYLTSYTIGGSDSHLIDNLKTDVFPHVGDNFREKAFYLGYVVNRLLSVKNGFTNPTDRDSFMYKRVDLSGFLLANLFRENYKQFQRDSKIAIDTEYRFNTGNYTNENYSNIVNEDNLRKIYNPNVIENSFMKSFKIGTILNKVGLIQALNRLSNVGTISHLRRINTTGDNIMIGQRKLHGTQYGIICPVEAPDGGNIGIKKHMATMTHITFGCSADPIIELLKEHEVVSLHSVLPEELFNVTKVFVNGRWIGVHYDPLLLVKILKLLRRNALINVFTSIAWDIPNQEINIFTDGGRCCRPLYICNDNNELLINKEHVKLVNEKKYNWFNLISGFKNTELQLDYYNCNYKCPSENNFNRKDLVKELEKYSGVIEFLDVDEMNNYMICNKPEEFREGINYSHCEIHPSLILGLVGYSIPYCNRNQAPRNIFGTGQTKQTVGMYISNYRNRFDGTANLLYYPQKPLINTRLSKYAFLDKLPTGINAIVAIASYSGYNQEDSIIFNKSSLQKGLFRSCYFKTYKSRENIDNKSGVMEFFFNKEEEEKNVNFVKTNNYSNTDDIGFAKEGAWVTDNDVLISQYTKLEDSPNEKYLDSSVVVKKDGYGVVDKVFSDYINTENHRFCKVSVVTTREPTLGDKFASRHGQKGVIGMVLPQEDMPYTKDGIVPDLIINPHAIPSRMTLGQFIECVTGKVCSLQGHFSDGTPFTDINSSKIGDVLEKECGFNRNADEILYNGIFGTQIKTKIFIGPTYYQRLKHMVKDKINSRERGKMAMKNRQPPPGRAQGGGLRIGEMERDAVIAHGMTQFLKESVMDRSDGYSMYISENTGQISIGNESKNRFICPNVDGPLEYENVDDPENIRLLTLNSKDTNIYKVNIPYSLKLMIQECEAMGISMRLIPRGNLKREELKLIKPTKKIVEEPAKKIVKARKTKVEEPIAESVIEPVIEPVEVPVEELVTQFSSKTPDWWVPIEGDNSPQYVPTEYN